MDDIIKAISLITVWYNQRFDLSGENAFTFEDFRLVSFDEGDGGSWSVTAVHNSIGDHYFLAVYDAEFQRTTVSQYQLVEKAVVRDEDLEIKVDREVDIDESG